MIWGGNRDFESVELEGNALNIQVSSPMGTMEITVVISGDELKGDTSFDTPQGAMTVQISGKRISGPEGAVKS